MQSKFSMKIEAFGYIERNTLLGRWAPAAQHISAYKVQLNLAGDWRRIDKSVNKTESQEITKESRVATHPRIQIRMSRNVK